MLTCIARPKKPGNDSLSKPDDSDPNNATTNAAKNQAIKSLTSQVRYLLTIAIARRTEEAIDREFKIENVSSSINFDCLCF
jgi:hypothetical protein